MAAERCPLCQSKLRNGECLSCGYRPPDEGDISALYNYDPTDYPHPQQDIREIIPDVQMEEIYPGRPVIPDIKVHDEQNNTVGRYGNGNNVGYNNAQGGYNAPGGYGSAQNGSAYGNQTQQSSNPNPYANNGNFTPYQSPQNNNNPNPYSSGNFRPYQKPSPYTNIPQINNSENINSYSDFFKKYWWALLLSFLMSPIGGIIFFAVFKDRLEAKYRSLFLAIMFLRIFFL